MFASLLAASTSNRYFLLEQTGQVSFLPLGKKNSLESRNSVCVCVSWLDKESKLSRNCQKKAILPKPSSLPPVRTFVALSIDFFPSFFSSFPSSCCVSQRRSFHISHATRTVVRNDCQRLWKRTGGDEGWGGEGRVNIRAVSSPMFLFRRSEELLDETMRSKRK